MVIALAALPQLSDSKISSNSLGVTINYSTVKNQIHQIIISEVAKYFNKAVTPAGLSLEDLRCLEIIAKMSQFEQDIKINNSSEVPPSPDEISNLLKIVKQSNKDALDE